MIFVEEARRRFFEVEICGSIDEEHLTCAVRRTGALGVSHRRLGTAVQSVVSRRVYIAPKGAGAAGWSVVSGHQSQCCGKVRVMNHTR